jgi:hypothetical protein
MQRDFSYPSDLGRSVEPSVSAVSRCYTESFSLIIVRRLVSISSSADE